MNQGTNRDILRHAAYAADDDLRIRREFHANYSQRTDNFNEWVVAQLPLRPTDRLLDVGAGPGDFLQQLHKKGHCGYLVGCDLSEGMMHTANAADSALSWAVADVQALPFADQRFDGILARHMLYHVPDIDQAVREMARVVRATGWVCAVTNSRDNLTFKEEIWDQLDHPQKIIYGRVDANFITEDAPAWFSPYFASVTTVVRADAIILTDVAPLQAYIRSGRHFLLAPGHTDTDWQGMVAELDRLSLAYWDKHAVDGVLTLPKQTGLILARTPH